MVSGSPVQPPAPETQLCACHPGEHAEFWRTRATLSSPLMLEGVKLVKVPLYVIGVESRTRKHKIKRRARALNCY